MIMRWLIRLAFPALGILLLLIFFGIDAPDNAGTAKRADDKTTIPAFEGLVPSPIPTEGPDIVFKWQDSSGNWHYADQPPATGAWNALAIERPGNESGTPPMADPETDWQSPYRAPFSLDPGNGS